MRVLMWPFLIALAVVMALSTPLDDDDHNAHRGSGRRERVARRA